MTESVELNENIRTLSEPLKETTRLFEDVIMGYAVGNKFTIT